MGALKALPEADPEKQAGREVFWTEKSLKCEKNRLQFGVCLKKV
jgi:hypothetical protein